MGEQDSAPEMKVEEITGVTVIGFAPGTSLDSGKIDRISLPFMDVVETPGLNKLVVNLQGVDYMASRALTMLIQAHRQLVGNGGQLRLAGLESQVREIFRVTNLTELFPIDDDLDEAISALR